MIRRALLVATVLALGACGRPGVPLPPERVAPQPVADVQGIVVADGIELSFSLPARRADNVRLRDLALVHVFRADDDGTGEPKPALVAKGHVVGYAEVAAVRVDDPGAAKIVQGRMTVTDRAGLAAGQRHSYVVLAQDARGHVSVPSPRVSLVSIAPPVAPAGVRAEAAEREVRLSWQAPARLQDGAAVDAPLAYQILRAPTAEAPLEVVATTAPGVTTFVDRGVENERAYVYALRAVRTARQTVARGPTSEHVTAMPVAMTPPRAPGDLVAIPSEGVVRLVWMASPDPDVGRYIVYRGRDGGPLERVGSVAAPGITFTDRDVAAGRWRYAVSAQDTSSRANESPASGEVTVTVP